jgi:hypothetical protein
MTRPRPTATSDDAASHDGVIAAVLAVITIAVYARVWTLGFVSYDDPGYVTDNPHVLGGLRWSGIVWAFTTSTEANWHPITWLSLMLDASLGGGAPAVFPRDEPPPARREHGPALHRAPPDDGSALGERRGRRASSRSIRCTSSPSRGSRSGRTC